MKRLEEKHKLGTRWTHWVNFPVLFVMIWSGMLIYWSNDVYRIGFGDLTVFHFFPDSVYNALHLDHSLAKGMAVHFLFMWFFAVNGFLYVSYTLLSGAWRELVPNKASFQEAIKVTLYDLGLSKALPPQKKYNGAQKIAYSMIIGMGLGSLLTGIAIYKPAQLSWLTALFGGYEFARIVHFVLTLGYLGFFVVHIAQVIKAGWNNFRSMLTGVELVEAKEVTGD